MPARATLVASRASDVLAIDVASAAALPLRRDARPGLASLPAIDASLETVTAFDGPSIPVIVHLPKGARTNGRRLPVIAQFHGGPQASASLTWNQWARFFVAQGHGTRPRQLSA